MASIDKDYFSHEYESEKNLTFHLRNLSIFIEEMVKTMGLNSIPGIKNKYPTRNSGFRFILSPICHNELWWCTFTDLSRNQHFRDIDVNNFYDRNIQIPQIINLYQLDEKLKSALNSLPCLATSVNAKRDQAFS